MDTITSQNQQESFNQDQGVNIINNIITFGYNNLKASIYDAIRPSDIENLPDKVIVDGVTVEKIKEPDYVNISLTKDEYLQWINNELIQYCNKCDIIHWGFSIAPLLISELPKLSCSEYYNTDIGLFLQRVFGEYEKYKKTRDEFLSRKVFLEQFFCKVKSFENKNCIFDSIYDLDVFFDRYIFKPENESMYQIKELLKPNIKYYRETYRFSKNRLLIFQEFFNKYNYEWLKFCFLYKNRCIEDKKPLYSSILECACKIRNIDSSYRTYLDAGKVENLKLQKEYSIEINEYTNRLNELKTLFDNKEKEAVILYNKYKEGKSEVIEEIISKMLLSSKYEIAIPQLTKTLNIQFSVTNRILLIDYQLPLISDTPNIKGYKTLKSKGIIKPIYYTDRETKNMYDQMLYSIVFRTIMEIFHYDAEKQIRAINFNGYVISLDTSIGKETKKCILSIQLKRDNFMQINPLKVDPKVCFKYFKGVSSSTLSKQTPIIPIMGMDKNDHRFIESQDIQIYNSTNLAAMNWEDFEHLIRNLFEKEFSVNGGEVKVTQASRDGGVDAIAYDPDPIRGGKIVIQAKRYTNTVGVSAVRDLYGTVLNEGANKGILVTTADYGSDSYEFAKGKPITLLNGGHLLYLLEKHGEKAIIDIEEAKKLLREK